MENPARLKKVIPIKNGEARPWENQRKKDEGRNDGKYFK
jgi:hypothetical protein